MQLNVFHLHISLPGFLKSLGQALHLILLAIGVMLGEDMKEDLRGGGSQTLEWHSRVWEEDKFVSLC